MTLPVDLILIGWRIFTILPDCLTLAGIAPKKRKGKEKKRMWVSKTANQKGKGDARGNNFSFFPLAAFIYPCLFAHQLEMSRLPFLY
jgi:hypothetical protein